MREILVLKGREVFLRGQNVKRRNDYYINDVSLEEKTMKVHNKIFKIFGALMLMVLMIATMPTSVVIADANEVKPALQAGADRLESLQNNDGGWDWPLDDGDPTNASPSNTIGPIAMGLAEAYFRTGNANHLTALSDAGGFLLTKTNNFSPSDGYLAAALDLIFGVSTYTNHVLANFYTPLADGTYDRNGEGTLYDTAAYVQRIRDIRTGTQANMAAWDIGMGVVGAAACGADTSAWVAGVKAEIDELDGDNYYDVLGLAGAVYGLAFDGKDFDPTAGEHAAASNVADLADILASYQIDGGGFAWNKDYVIANDGNETIQGTSYAILALNEVDRALYLDEIQGAADYMLSVQLDTDGWRNYNYEGTSSTENNEITGEAMWGIANAYTSLWVCETGDCGHPGYQYSSIQAAINAADNGAIIHVMDGNYNDVGGTVVNKSGLIIILEDGVVIQNSSPCFTVSSGNTKITTESIGGAKCVATNGSSGIEVGGIDTISLTEMTDVIIEGLEITGSSGLYTENGIEFQGNITDLQIVNNYIHDLGGRGIYFAMFVYNNQGIQGNMFKNLGMQAIEYGMGGIDDLNAQYNSWGANAAPSPMVDIIGADADPYTFVELKVTSSGALSESQVAVGDTITYTVTADLTEVTGADFVLKYPSDLLTYESSTLVTSLFEKLPEQPSVLKHDGVEGKIWFGGTAPFQTGTTPFVPITETDEVLFTVTFTATTTTGTGALNLDELTDVFSMFPDPTYSSVNPSNNIYANGLIDGEVTVVAKPTITPMGYDGFFAVGVTEQFSLDIDNPTDGGTYANPQLVFDLAGSGATLEYWNGSTWVVVTSPDYEVVLPQLNPSDYTSDFYFNISFPASGSYAISVDLVDTDAEGGVLAEAALGADVVDNYSVIGTISMQGRTVRSGVLVTLTMLDPALFGPFSGTTVDIITNNLTITGVAEDTYTVTTYQPRYLNVTAALAKTITVDGADYTMAPLELRGGNAVWVNDNVINVQDASAVGSDYGKTGDMDADVNFDGKVNIQDLALVGGNFDLTSEHAYSDVGGVYGGVNWTP
jgi:hypothetical protein